MKIPFPLKPILLSSLLLLGLTSCERTRKTETRTEADHRDTVTVTRTETKTKPNDELNEFRDWVNKKTTQADTNAKRRWPKVKEEFKTKSAQVEQNLDSLSEDSKREYAELKKRYENWEKTQEARSEQPLDETTLNTWRRQLLGDRSAYSTITGANAKETYLLFMGIVRAKAENWSQNDWDYVDHVYSELNDRKSQIESRISAIDRLKIKSLQAEYLALEGTSDAKDAYRNVKK
jgi:hypothetical protein